MEKTVPNKEETANSIRIKLSIFLSALLTIAFSVGITLFGFRNCFGLLYDGCIGNFTAYRACSLSVIYNFWNISPVFIISLMILSLFGIAFVITRYLLKVSIPTLFSLITLTISSFLFSAIMTTYFSQFFTQTKVCTEYMPVTKESCATIGMIDELTCTCEEPDCAEKPEELEYKESDYCVNHADTDSKHCEFIGMDLAVDMDNSWDVMISADSRYNTFSVDNVILSNGSLTVQISNGGLGWECSSEYDCTESLFFENDLLSLTLYKYLHGSFIAGKIFQDSDRIGIIINHINGEILDFTDEEKIQIEEIVDSFSEL